MNIDVNYVTVLLAAVSSMVVGFLWYSPILFAKPWMKEMEYTDKSMKKKSSKMGPMYALSFAAALVTAYVMYHVMVVSMSFYNTDPVTSGLMTAFWSWLGFVMPVQLTDVIFGGRSFKLLLLNIGYQLAAMLSMGLVLGSMM